MKEPLQRAGPSTKHLHISSWWGRGTSLGGGVGAVDRVGGGVGEVW